MNPHVGNVDGSEDLTSVSIAAAMQRATALASRGPLTGGNPRVGCVILSPADASEGHTILAEGWHEGAGTPHAEAAAITHAKSHNIDLTGSIFVVTLEPCNHTGRTGPCSEAIIQAGASAVHYAVSDATKAARGGAAHLASAGIETHHFFNEHAAQLTSDWAFSRESGMPHIILKTAMTLDGKVAAVDGTSQWITGPAARRHAHGVRASVDAIIVGTGTVLADDPSLTARLESGELAAHQPHVIVIGKRDIPAEAKLRNHPGGFTHWTSHDLKPLLRELAARGLWRGLVEGGPTLVSAFAAAGMFRELHCYIAPVLLGDGKPGITNLGITTLDDARRGRFTTTERLGEDILVTYRTTPSDQGELQ